jgi:hypothetical protein
MRYSITRNVRSHSCKRSVFNREIDFVSDNKYNKQVIAIAQLVILETDSYRDLREVHCDIKVQVSESKWNETLVAKSSHWE